MRNPVSHNTRTGFVVCGCSLVGFLSWIRGTLRPAFELVKRRHPAVVELLASRKKHGGPRTGVSRSRFGAAKPRRSMSMPAPSEKAKPAGTLQFPTWTGVLSASDVPARRKESHAITIRWFLGWCRRGRVPVHQDSARQFIDWAQQEKQAVEWQVEQWKEALRWFFRTGHTACAAPRLRNAPARSGHGYSHRPRALGPQRRQHDADLYARAGQTRSWRAQSTR